MSVLPRTPRLVWQGCFSLPFRQFFVWKHAWWFFFGYLDQPLLNHQCGGRAIGPLTWASVRCVWQRDRKSTLEKSVCQEATLSLGLSQQSWMTRTAFQVFRSTLGTYVKRTTTMSHPRFHPERTASMAAFRVKDPGTRDVMNLHTWYFSNRPSGAKFFQDDHWTIARFDFRGHDDFWPGVKSAKASKFSATVLVQVMRSPWTILQKVFHDSWHATDTKVLENVFPSCFKSARYAFGNRWSLQASSQR